MEERDYYWDTIFDQQRRWTDYELQKRDYIDDAYCSYLVTPQRRRKRLQVAISKRRAADCASVLALHPTAVGSITNDIGLQTYHSLCLSLVNGDTNEYNRRLAASSAEPAFGVLAQLLKTSHTAAVTVESRKNSSDDAETRAESDQAPESRTRSEDNLPASPENEDIAQVEDGDRISRISYKPFELSDVPAEELRRRLNKGEIAPRDEWIPSGDTTNKKSITPAEARERLGFAERLRSEAMAHLTSDKLEEAATFFIQGCHLLEYYKCESDAGLDEKVQNELRRFRLNAARVCLKLQKFREAMVYVDDQLKDDPGDGVAMYLRGKSFEEAGDYDRAYQEYNALRKSVYASDAERKTGLIALHRLRKGYSSNSIKLKNMLEIYKQTLPDMEDDYVDYSATENDDPSQTNSVNQCVASTQQPRVSIPMKPVIEKHQDMINLLEALLKTYTSPAVTAELESIRFKADFDESKTIRALRKYLPEILSPLLIKYGYGSESDDYVTLKKKFDQDVLYHRHAPGASEDERSQISTMMRDLHEVLLGTPLD